MKKLFIAIFSFFTLLTANTEIYSQVTGIGSAGGRYEMVFIPGQREDNSEKFKNIAHKMFLTEAYLPAKISDVDQNLYIRYNIYRDEMEFTKNNETLYLKKDSNRTITFIGTQEKYGLFELNDKLRYFQIHNSGKTKLLTRKIVLFSDEKPAASSYQQAKPADFKRKDDEIYISFKDNELVEVPSNKKKFYQIFNEKSGMIKKYIKGNKLNIKKINDLIKIITHYDSI